MHLKWSLLLLVLLFGLPPLAGWLFYLNPAWLPAGRSNNGQLIQPPRAVDAVSLLSPDGESLPWQALAGQWQLTVFASGSCAVSCRQRLAALRQVRRALGPPGEQVGSLLILLPDAQAAALQPPSRLPPGVRIASVSGGDAGRVRELFQLSGVSLQTATFLIDPRSRLMMVYDQTRSQQQLLEDLQLLLKATQNWTTETRYDNS